MAALLNNQEVMPQPSYVDTIRHRLTLESGTLQGHGRRNLALVYPGPYNVGMSSLGFQTVYRLSLKQRAQPLAAVGT